MRKTVSTATKAWLESPHRHDIDTAAEHVLQKDEHAHMTAKRGGSLELDEDVAVWAASSQATDPNSESARQKRRAIVLAGRILQR